MTHVSVVVPTHNRGRLLGRTLRSICAQQSVDLEVLVVDDGSSDDSAVVAAAVDARVRLLRNPQPAGVSAARNRGIAAARGKWIAFCDDDDLWAPEKLCAQLSAVERARAGWVYTGDVNVDDQLQVLSGSPPPTPDMVTKTLPRWNPLASGASNVMIRADVLAATGGFNPRLRRTEDWDLWIRLASTGPPACVRKPLVAYRFHATNIVTDLRSMVDEPRQLAERYRIPVDLAAMHRRAAWTALRGGRRGAAIRHYAGAVARGDLRSIARGAFALCHPRVGSDSLFGVLRRDSVWVAEAQQWLSTLVEPHAAQPAERGR